LHLGQYLCSNPSLVKDKRVLELGAGTGYLAVLCAKYLGSEHVIASDGSDEVVRKLPGSCILNGLQGTERVSVMELKWGQDLGGSDGEVSQGLADLDTILGADITYDASAIPPLVTTLSELARLSPGVSILIAATERNRATFESFLDACRQRGFAVSYKDFAVQSEAMQNGPFYNDASPIHICQLSV
jgi:predicted nicotinamide N-methyase